MNHIQIYRLLESNKIALILENNSESGIDTVCPRIESLEAAVRTTGDFIVSLGNHVSIDFPDQPRTIAEKVLKKEDGHGANPNYLIYFLSKLDDTSIKEFNNLLNKYMNKNRPVLKIR